MLKRLKEAINILLEKIAKENEKAYGRSVPDCCQLNRQSSNRMKKVR